MVEPAERHPLVVPKRRRSPPTVGPVEDYPSQQIPAGRGSIDSGHSRSSLRKSHTQGPQPPTNVPSPPGDHRDHVP